MMVVAECVAVMAIFWLVLGAVAAHASEPGAADQRAPRLLAYAAPTPERFGEVFVSHAAVTAAPATDGHPLNDAWMGMTVVTADGRIAGYVSDAFLHPDGSIADIVVTPADAAELAHPVYVPARFALLEAGHVSVGLSMMALKMMEPVTEDIAGLGR